MINHECPSCNYKIGFFRKFLLMDHRYKNFAKCKNCKATLKVPTWFYFVNVIQAIILFVFVIVFGVSFAWFFGVIFTTTLFFENLLLPIILVD